MLPLARNGYTTAQVAAALHAPLRRLSFRYALHQANDTYRFDLGTVSAASIAYASEAQIQRTARFTLREDDSINYGSDRIRPYCRLRMLDGGVAEFLIGTFLLSTVPRAAAGGVVTRSIAAYDAGQLLLDTKTTGRYSIPAGTAFTAAVETLLGAAGFLSMRVAPSAALLPVTREWVMGTSYLTIINDLLKALNYDPIFCDELGVPVVRPFLSAAVKGVDYSYPTNAQSVVLPGVTQNLDLFAIPNDFVLVLSQADRPTLTGRYTNSNPASPTSTVSRGRTIVQVDTQADAVDQGTLDALAARTAFEQSQVYETITVNTGIMPMHGHQDVLQLVHTDLGLNAKYQEVGWSFACKAGAQMSHQLRRTVAV